MSGRDVGGETPIRAGIYASRGISLDTLDTMLKKVFEKAPWPLSLIASALDEQTAAYRADSRRKFLLSELFGTSHPVFGQGSTDHLQGTAAAEFRLLKGELYYPSDSNALRAVRSCLLGAEQFAPAAGYIPGDTAGSLFVIGSSVADPVTRQYLGPVDSPKKEVLKERYRAKLHYNYAAPAQQVIVLNCQQGRNRPWEELNWGIEIPGDTVYPRRRSNGFLDTDLLLVTRLPSERKGAGDVIISGGTHGAGSQALELILQIMDLEELEELYKQVQHRPHFQAVFQVAGLTHEGHTCGSEIHLLYAKPVDIEWSPDADWTK